MRAAREHAEIDFYEQCMTFKPLHYTIQDTIHILMDKGLTLERAIRDLPINSQEDAKRIYQRTR